MITGDLDRALASALAAVGDLPFTPGSWRPAPGGGPASYATSLAAGLAALAGRPARDLAADLARRLGSEPWIAAARPAAGGYLTIEVTARALAASAAAMAAAGPACAASTILAGSTAADVPWPDLAVQPDWPQAWRAQAEAMTGRLARAAGAGLTEVRGPSGQRGPLAPRSALPAPSSPAAAVAYLGTDAVRYWLARIAPGRMPPGEPGPPGQSGPFSLVQQAHAEAASTLRWAADLRVERSEPEGRLAVLLADPAEQALLGLLSWLPVRVAAAARRQRPDELPRYLERVGQAWLECRRARPALPFGGRAAASDPAGTAARLMLAGAARAVLAAGLALTGVAAPSRA